MGTEDIRLKFAKKLRQLRQQKGLTQEELAWRAGISYKHLQKLESKNPSPVKITTVEKLAHALEVNRLKFMDF